MVFTAMPPTHLRWGRHETPCGPLMLGLDEENALRRIDFAQKRRASSVLKIWREHWPQAAFQEEALATEEIIRAYFEKTPLALKISVKGTAFQQQVWNALLAIPSGTTISYGELAQKLGNSNAARAVGNALNANPVPLFIPCHRVIAGKGSLGGYAGGADVKRVLLARES